MVLSRSRPFRQPGATKYGKRHKPGEMNKTEAKYAEALQARKLAGEIEEWYFEGSTFKLAADCRYTPDFEVYLADGSIEYVDVKGSGPIDPKSRVKIRMAAQLRPWFRWVMEQQQTVKNGGGWKREEF